MTNLIQIEYQTPTRVVSYVRRDLSLETDRILSHLLHGNVLMCPRGRVPWLRDTVQEFFEKPLGGKL